MLRAFCLSFALSSTLGLVACDGNDAPARSMNDAPDGGESPVGPATPLSGGDRFLEEYAAAVCTMYAPCCAAEDRGYSERGCVDWFRKITAAVFSGEFVASKGAACLSALNAAVEAQPDRCGAVPLFDEATLRTECSEAFAPPERSGNALGQSCLMARECASSPDGPVICDGHCLLERRGADGDGPCSLVGQGLVTEQVKCNATDGLYCDRRENVCRPHVATGEYCPVGNACGPGGLCSGGTCVALGGPGEPCANAIPGSGGFCRAGSACNKTTLVCGEALPVGASCREPGECATRVCTGGACGEPEFTRRLNCTG